MNFIKLGICVFTGLFSLSKDTVANWAHTHREPGMSSYYDPLFSYTVKIYYVVVVSSIPQG